MEGREEKKSKLQVLVSTMNQTDKSLIKRMNLRGDALVINQGSDFSREEWIENGNKIEWYNFAERGVGRSRNAAWMRASGDIVLFADDDVQYKDDYIQVIQEEFKRHTDADVILFNVESTNKNRPEYQNVKFHRVHFYNYLRYGTFRIAIKRDSLWKYNIAFSLLFGGGSRYGSGEDSLFLTDCIKKKMKIYASPKKIGYVNHRESTWFSEYNEKYFYDKGALFAAISKKYVKILCLQYCIRHKNICEHLGTYKAYKYMLKGANEFEGR